MSGLSSRPRLWLHFKPKVASLIAVVPLILGAVIYRNNPVDVVYVSYFSAAAVLLYFTRAKMEKHRCWKVFLGLLILSALQFSGVVSNIFRGEFVVNDFACGLSSEPSFNALILYWLLCKSERGKFLHILCLVFVFFVTRSFMVVLCSLCLLAIPTRLYRWTPVFILAYILFIRYVGGSSLLGWNSLGELTLYAFGSWRELATESLLVYNLTNAGGPIIEAVYGGQTMLRNSSIFWIDTTYSLLSVLSMWNSFVALAFMAVYLRVALSRIDKHLVFIGFVIAPKWMLFYLICNSVRS